MSLQLKQLYEFEGYSMDADGRSLRRDGEPVPLTPKAFDTLLVLVRHSGRVVGKDELLKEVWPDTFVEEATLTQNISTLRKALGRDRSGRQFIETVPKHGYRFTAPVSEVTDDAAEVMFVKQVTRTHIVAEESEAPQTEASPINYQSPNGNGAARTAADTHALLEGVEPSAEPRPAPSRLLKRPRALLIILPMVVIIGGALAALRFLGRGGPGPGGEQPFRRMRIAKLTNSGNVMRVALSADGSYAAYAVNEGGLQSLWLRRVSEANSVQIVAPRNLYYTGATFSNGGDFIYFTAREKDSALGILYMVPLLGGAPRKIIEDVDGGVALSPDGRKLAFVRQTPSAGVGELIVANADGSGARTVARRSRPDMISNSTVAWSPDGGAIVYSVRVGENTDPYTILVEVRPDGGGERVLTKDRWAWIAEAAWLKDGSGIIFNAMDTWTSDFSPKLWMLSHADGKVSKVINDLNSYQGVSLARGGGGLLAAVQTDRVANFWVVPVAQPSRASRITVGPNDQIGEQMGLAWAAGGHIVFGSTASGNLDVWVMDTDGKNQKQLTFDPHPDLRPAVSPDGRSIVFVSWRTGSPHLWRMNIDGNNLMQLTDGDAETLPDFSPDGRWVFYTYIGKGDMNIWRVPAEGGPPVRVTEDRGARPAVSPDGKHIAYFQFQRSSPLLKLAVVPFEGGAPARIFDLPADIFPAAGLRWSHDGRDINYVVTKGQVSNVWSQPLENKAPRLLTDFSSDQIFRFAWSPDGKYLLMERGIEINDAVLVSSLTE